MYGIFDRMRSCGHVFNWGACCKRYVYAGMRAKFGKKRDSLKF